MAEEDKIHVSASKRGFGLGFGAEHWIAVYTEDGPKTGALLSEAQCKEIEKWKGSSDDKRWITDIVKPAELAEALQNRLLHADTIELARMLPNLLKYMDMNDREVLIRPVNNIPADMWKEIADTRPELVKNGFNKDNPEAYFNKLLTEGEGRRISRSGFDIEFNGVSMEAMAMVLPVLFAAIKENKSAATRVLTGAMRWAGEDKKFFGELADVDINRLVISNDKAGACQDIINNGRTVMIRSTDGPEVRFQGDNFISSNLHFHPLKNDDESKGPVRNVNGEADDKPEFKRYKNAEHQKLCEKEPHLDPNRNVVGQLHAIFTSNGRRAILLGADVEIGEHNAEFGKYIDHLKVAKGDKPLEIITDPSDAQEVKAKAVQASELKFNPLACFNGKFNADGVPEAPFMSLHLGGMKVYDADAPGIKDGMSDIFYRGVRVLYLPEAITISKEQLKDLRDLQPVLRSVDEETCVHPTARFQHAEPLWKDISRRRSGEADTGTPGSL